LVDAFHVPKLLSQQLLLFGRSGDGLEELTFGVEQFSALSMPCGRSTWTWRTVRVVNVRRVFFVFLLGFAFNPWFFEFWLGEVSDGPRVPGGQSAGVWRTVLVLPADGLLFAVRLWRFCCLFWIVRGSSQTVRSKGADSPRYPAGQSARPLQTVCPAWPDSPPEPGSFVPWFDSSLLLSCFRVCFKESFLRLEVDP
jgi:hypothetical protein